MDYMKSNCVASNLHSDIEKKTIEMKRELFFFHLHALFIMALRLDHLINKKSVSVENDKSNFFHNFRITTSIIFSFHGLFRASPSFILSHHPFLLHLAIHVNFGCHGKKRKLSSCFFNACLATYEEFTSIQFQEQDNDV